jgi:threonine/homoserine/homoserine lactone efflux protein
MDITALLIFAGALAIAAGSPGPSIAALVARVISRGPQGVVPFAAAMWVGEAVWLTLAVFGLGVIAHSFYLAFVAIKYAGLVYLLYLAYKMWTAPVEVRDGAPQRADPPLRMFLAGLTVTLGNPKIMVFYLALLPTIVDLAHVSLWGWGALTLVMLAVLALIDIGYIVLAARARRFIRSARAMRAANRCSATAMGGAAVLMATR